MRKVAYLATFAIIGISAFLLMSHFAGLAFLGPKTPSFLLWFSLPVNIFGKIPLPAGPNPSMYVQIACSAPLVILAGRRLILLAQTGSFTPPEFRGFAYVLALLGLAIMLIAGGVYLVTRSAVLSFVALSWASYPLLLSFVVAELAGPLTSKPWLKRSAIATAGMLLVGMFVPWDTYVAKLAYEKLCASRSGEKVYATVKADGYLLVGEAPGSDSVRIETAVDDVLSRRAQFVEVQRFPYNATQSSSLNDYFNYKVPNAKYFRIAVAAQGSSGCLPANNSPIRRASAKGQLKDGECIQFYPVEAPKSRYRVEVEANAKPVWYTWRIFMQRVSASEQESGRLLGESTIFQRVGRVSSDREHAELECPIRHNRRPLTELHSKVLLGGP